MIEKGVKSLEATRERSCISCEEGEKRSAGEKAGVGNKTKRNRVKEKRAAGESGNGKKVRSREKKGKSRCQ